jgi:hypothetical protein
MASAFALCAMCYSAGAVSIIDVSNGALPPGVLPTPSATTPVVGVHTGTSVGAYRDPFEGTAQAGITPFLSIQGTPTTGSATFNYLTGANQFSLIWGSVDTYNQIVFSGGNIVGSITVTGAQIPTTTPSAGHDFVTISMDPGKLFTTVTLLNNPGINAFEIDNVTACLRAGDVCAPLQNTTPIPAALPLFATGIAGVGGLLGWRKKKKAKAIAA